MSIARHCLDTRESKWCQLKTRLALNLKQQNTLENRTKLQKTSKRLKSLQLSTRELAILEKNLI